MKTIEQRRLEVLNDTIAHFNCNNRAVKRNVTCTYSHSANGGCAIGRLVSADIAEEMEEGDREEWSNTAITNPQLFNRLPPDIQELGVEFLSYLQIMHDSEDFWNESGLTGEGPEWADKLHQTFCIPKYIPKG